MEACRKALTSVGKTHHHCHQLPDRNLISIICVLSVYGARVARERQNFHKCVICIPCVEGVCRTRKTRCEVPQLAVALLVQVWGAGSHRVTFPWQVACGPKRL